MKEQNAIEGWASKHPIAFAILFLLAMFMAVQTGKGQAPTPPTPPATTSNMQLTPAGKLAFRALVREYQELLTDINTLTASEVAQQHLESGKWQLDMNTGTLMRVGQPPAPPAAATPKPAGPLQTPPKPTALTEPRKESK